MPIVDTRQFARLTKKKKRRSKVLLVLLFVTILGVIMLFVNTNKASTPNATTNVSINDTEQHHKQEPTLYVRQFSPEEFNTLALSIKYPNTQLFEDPLPITGDEAADKRIRQIAEKRGYKMTSIPVGPIQKIDEPRLEGDDLLQPLAAAAWHSLKTAALKDNMPLSITSAYRSPEYQRNLFMARLNASGATIAQVAAGTADRAVEAVLAQAAAPGYSRHHTGYTIDLWCEDGSGAFLVSSCFRWISADNYKIAKEHGWIPSYPEGVELQGPEPEPWEYVWVGTALVAK